MLALSLIEPDVGFAGAGWAVEVAQNQRRRARTVTLF